METYSVFSGALNKMPQGKKLLVNTINQYSYCIAEKDSEFKAALQGSDVLLPDGIGVVGAVRLLTGKKIRKIAGADMHRYLLEELNKKGGKCFYLGSSDSTLKKIVSRLSVEYPSVQEQTYSPPYKPHFTEEESVEMVTRINRFNPDVVFVGMTAPKQEKWAYAHKEKINAKIICSIGAVFDFYSGTISRPGGVWINFGMEWLGRLVKEPKRMWKRYLYYGPVFLWYLARSKAGFKV